MRIENDRCDKAQENDCGQKSERPACSYLCLDEEPVGPHPERIQA